MSALSQQQQQGLAAIVDKEMSVFKQKQEKLTKLRQKQQTLMEQHSENEMVKAELLLLTPSNVVYKKVGPILMKHERSEAVETVEKRLEFIKGDQQKVEAQAKALEDEMQSIVTSVREKQMDMQRQAQEEAMKAAQQAKGEVEV
mmetsp:Transcript_19050/g.39675  ORF Transcript_19050/g.39675 Transcript_19050/m.39675 type:complete len:144 (+) Transcript_19050:114-545(+)